MKNFEQFYMKKMHLLQNLPDLTDDLCYLSKYELKKKFKKKGLLRKVPPKSLVIVWKYPAFK